VIRMAKKKRKSYTAEILEKVVGLERDVEWIKEELKSLKNRIWWIVGLLITILIALLSILAR